MKRIATTAVILMVALADSVISSEPPQGRPKSWAQPVELKGAPNLFKVSKSLYRGAQPTPEGMRHLKTLGVVTVVNLRSFHSDRDEIGTTGLAYEHIYMKAWHPERKEIVRFLQIVRDRKRTPVFLHCQHGADRTGTMAAIYRITIEGWTKEDAIREMTKGGFGFHTVWDNLPDWIRGLDIESIREEAGITNITEEHNTPDLPTEHTRKPTSLPASQ